MLDTVTRRALQTSSFLSGTVPNLRTRPRAPKVAAAYAGSTRKSSQFHPVEHRSDMWNAPGRDEPSSRFDPLAVDALQVSERRRLDRQTQRGIQREAGPGNGIGAVVPESY